MDNYYRLLGIKQSASPQDIKKAFREQAKHLHPDIAGAAGAEKMRKLLTAYEVLSDQDRRYEYDRAYSHFIEVNHFDYRAFLREQKDDPESQARLVFFNLLHLEEEEALAIWRAQGGLDFPMEKYLDREDWMDCLYILAEELEKRQYYYDAFMLLIVLVREERQLPYFRHFMGDVESFLKEIVRLKLRSSVDPETYVACLEILLEMGFPPKEEARWMRSMAETLIHLGKLRSAETVFREALKLDPGLPNAMRLRKRLQV
jgi:tetratricopeptide (TPR) repeat protein